MIVRTFRPHFSRLGLDLRIVLGQGGDRGIDVAAPRAGDENEIGVPGGIGDARRRPRRIHEQRPSEARLWRDEGIDQPPVPALAAHILLRRPQRLHQLGELVRHRVALVVVDLLVAEHARFAGHEPGHDVETPPAVGDVVDGRAELGEIKRMPRPVEHVDGRDEKDALGDHGERGRGDERVERLLAKPDSSAGAAFSHPLREPEGQIESQRLGALGEPGVIVELPRRAARQARWRPAAALDRQEQPEEQRLLHDARERRIRKLER